MSAIVFDNVSRSFILHHSKARSFQDMVLKSLRLRKNGNGTHEEFWALRDLSFEIAKGQMVGFIGPNGAGKSTLLKLIAQLIAPTRGKIAVHGSINSLIELTAGFHLELTGRENIYLSGALRGMTRRDIQKRFDEIVAFSELEKFIDTQVKRYSSGMYVRLGFAIASCIESDILLVDEVLAVGDAYFKRKSHDRFKDIRERGTTVVYVSHQMAEVENSCDRAFLLMDGTIQADGDPVSVIRTYQMLTDQIHPRVKSISRADYIEYNAPDTLHMRERLPFSVTVRNTSDDTWQGPASTGTFIVSLGYHWIDAWGIMQQAYTPRIFIPQDVPPGECFTLKSFALPPREPGLYTLELDLMLENVGWFSTAGCRGPRVKVEVLPPRAHPISKP